MTRSIAFRIAAVTTLLTLIAVVMLAAMTLITVQKATTATLAATVATDMTGLVDIYASGGREEMVKRINDRIALTGSAGQSSSYAVLDHGRRVAGDWPAASVLDPARSEQGFVGVGDDSRYARATTLGPGLTLYVARVYPDERALMTKLRWMFAIVGGGVVIASAGLALASARALATRVAAINRAYATDERNAVSALQADRTRDEVGELARNSGHALARVTALVDAQRQVSDQIAHEIRTPLAHLDRRVTAIGRHPGLADETRQARNQIASLTTLLDSLLDIAASEARRGDRRGFASIDLSALVEGFGDLYGPSLEDAGLRFTVAVEPAIVFEGNAMDLQRMVSNLLDNAVRHVPAGHSVRLELARGPAITVSDDGPGIAPALQPRVFDRFTRSEGGGHGLGLALVRAIAHQHGLSVTLSTASGTSFVIAPAS